MKEGIKNEKKLHRDTDGNSNAFAFDMFGFSGECECGLHWRYNRYRLWMRRYSDRELHIQRRYELHDKIRVDYRG